MSHEHKRNELFGSRQSAARDELFGSSKASGQKKNTPKTAGPGPPARPPPGPAPPAAAAAAPAAAAPAAAAPAAGRLGPGRAAFRPALSPQQAAEKEREAAACRKKGLKLLSKTLTRWRPDFLTAASQFERAGRAYRALGGRDPEARAMFLEGAKCQMENEAWALAAKDYREAALLAEMADAAAEAARYYELGARAWVQAHDPARAADYVSRAAQQLEGVDPDAAAAAHKRACEHVAPPPAVDPADPGRRLPPEAVDVRVAAAAADAFDRALGFALATLRFELANDICEGYTRCLQAGESKHTLHKVYLCHAACLLRLGDEVAADRLYRDVHLQDTAYLSSPWAQLSEKLLVGKQALDTDALQAVAADPRLRHLPQSWQHLVRGVVETALEEMAGENQPGSSSWQDDRLAEEQILMGGADPAPEPPPRPGAAPPAPPPRAAAPAVGGARAEEQEEDELAALIAAAKADLLEAAAAEADLLEAEQNQEGEQAAEARPLPGLPPRAAAAAASAAAPPPVAAKPLPPPPPPPRTPPPAGAAPPRAAPTPALPDRGGRERGGGTPPPPPGGGGNRSRPGPGPGGAGQQGQGREGGEGGRGGGKAAAARRCRRRRPRRRPGPTPWPRRPRRRRRRREAVGRTATRNRT